MLIAGLSGCSATVGDKATQAADKIDTVNRGPTSARMVDKDRGTLALDGAGPGRYLYLDKDSVETQSTGSTNRSMFYDGATGRFVLDSGSDVTAEGVEIRPNGDGKLGLVKIEKFSTISSEPTRASNEAYDRLAEVWKARDEASKEAILAEIDALKITAPEIADAIIGLLSGL
jgi:hypothetical protein